MNNETDQKIFAWLNPCGCWHDIGWEPEPESDFEGQCQKCEAPISNAPFNPSYTTPEGFFLLLTGLGWKDVEVYLFTNGEKAEASLEIPTGGEYVAHTDTLPEALAAATVEMLEAEGKL